MGIFFGQGFPLNQSGPQVFQNDIDIQKAYPGIILDPTNSSETQGQYSVIREINGDRWIIRNADYTSGTGFFLYNVAQPATAFVHYKEGGLATYEAPANSAPGFTWTRKFYVDANGVLQSPTSNTPLPNDLNIYNVLSYGAKGDGVTDDTQAFVKAIAAAQASITATPATYATATGEIGAWSATSGNIMVGLNVNGVVVTATAAYNISLADITSDLVTAVNTNSQMNSAVSLVANSPRDGFFAITAVPVGASGNDIAFSVSSGATVGLASAPYVAPTETTNLDGGQNSTSVGGAIVYAPAGGYNLVSANSSSLLMTKSNCYIKGAQLNATKILLPPGVRGFSWDGVSGGGARDIAIRYNVVAGSGSGSEAAIYTNNCNYMEFVGVSIAQTYIGFQFLDGGTYMLERCQVNGWSDGFGAGSLAGILLDGVKYLGPQGLIILQSHIGGGRRATMDGIVMRRGGGIIVLGCGFLRCHHGINICPIGAKVNNVNIASTNVDAATNVPCVVQPGVNGIAIKLHFTDFYCKTAGSTGMQFMPAANSGQIASVDIVNQKCYNNRGYGLQIQATAATVVTPIGAQKQVSDFNIVGGFFTGNGVGSSFGGIGVIGPVDNVAITGADCSGYTIDSPEQQTNGVFIDDGGLSKPTRLTIRGCNVRDNSVNGIRTGPAQDFSMIDSSDWIADNPGFNPYGHVTAPNSGVPPMNADFANPFGVPAQVFMAGGTPHNIFIKGVGNTAGYTTTGLLAGTFMLAPAEIIKATYDFVTTAPSWAWVLQ